MELIAGPTLTDVIARGRVAGPEAARVGREIAEAFAVIHGRGIVHRDVKPSNILLRPAAHAGETRGRPWPTSASLLWSGDPGHARDTVIGTAAYLSPEQARGMPAAPASDVYSLGLVLLEALTGSRPFGSRTPHEALAARLVSAPEIPAHIPAAWREVLERMTAVDPAERPDATGLIVAMRTLSNVPVAAPGAEATARLPAARTSTAPTRVLGASGADPTPTSTARRRPSRRTVIVASVVAAVIAAGGVTAAVAAAAGESPNPTCPRCRSPSTSTSTTCGRRSVSDPPHRPRRRARRRPLPLARRLHPAGRLAHGVAAERADRRGAGVGRRLRLRLSSLDALEAEVVARRDAGEITAEEADGILTRIATVRADLSGLVPTPTPDPSRRPSPFRRPSPRRRSAERRRRGRR